MSGTPGPNTAAFTLAEILACCGQQQCCGAKLLTRAKEDILNRPLRGVFIDSRSITPGALFLAISGDKHDGHTFLKQVAAAGAGAAIVEKEIAPSNAPEGLPLLRVNSTLATLGMLAHCHREKLSCKIIGITGSYGKTTTRAMIAAALGAQQNVLSSQENFNNEIGVPQTLLQLDETHQSAVIEMGMRGKGEIAYLAKMAAPQIGVITNIGPQHIELLGSLQNIAAAKAELLQVLPQNGVAILPADNEMFEFLKDQTSARVVTFGATENAQYRVISSTFDEEGMNFCRIETPHHGILELRLALPGAHNAQNAAAALAVADVCGIDLPLAVEALQAVQVPGARMQLRHARNALIIDDCYNAGPASMRAALEVLEQFPGAKRRVAVLGAMRELGDWTEKEHRATGIQAARIAELLIGVGEETKVLLEAAQKQGHQQTHWFEDAATAAAWLPERIQPGDVILVKGSRSVGLEKVVEAACTRN